MKPTCRVIATMLAAIMIVQFLAFSNVYAAAGYKAPAIEKALSASDAEYLFGNYGNFTTKYLNDVKTLDVFLFFFSNPFEMLRSLKAGIVPDEIAKRFMNDVESVKPILREAIGEMTNNKDLKILSSDDKYILKRLEKYCKNVGFAGIEEAIGELLQVFKTIENVEKVIADYAENIMMLDALREIFPENSSSRKMIDKLEEEYSNQFFAAIKDHIKKGIEKTAIKAIDPLGVYSSIQSFLENDKSIGALEYVIYSSALQSESVQAYRKTVKKIMSGNYSKEDVVRYINAFELCRIFTLKLYEKMRNNYNSKDSEYAYLTEHISYLRIMTYDDPIKAQTYSEWLKGGRRNGSFGSSGGGGFRDGGSSGGSGGGGFRGDTSLSAPTALNIEKTGNSTVRVSWNPVSGALSYEAQYKSPKTNYIWVKDTDYKNCTATSYASVGMVNGRTYMFRVRAVNASGTSDWSEEYTYVHYGTAVSSEKQPALTVVNTDEGNYIVTIPANTTVYGFSSPTSTTRIKLYTPKTTPFTLYCTKHLSMSDGTLRYFFRSGGNTAQDYYLMFTDSMSVTAYCTVTYDADGGSGAPPSQTVVKGYYWTASSVIPTREGYTFVGWADAPGTYYALMYPNDSARLHQDKTVYAVWRKTPEPSMDPPELTVYKLGSGWINMSYKSIGGATSTKKYQCSVYFGVEYKILCSKAIDSYGIDIFDSNMNLLTTIPKSPVSSAEKWISEKTNIYRLDYLDNEGSIENVSHNPLYTPLQRGQTYYWRVYFVCDGQRAETELQSFVFTVADGW